MCAVGDHGYGTEGEHVGNKDVDELIDYSSVIDGGDVFREVNGVTSDKRDR